MYKWPGRRESTSLGEEIEVSREDLEYVRTMEALIQEDLRQKGDFGPGKRVPVLRQGLLDAT